MRHRYRDQAFTLHDSWLLAYNVNYFAVAWMSGHRGEVGIILGEIIQANDYCFHFAFNN